MKLPRATTLLAITVALALPAAAHGQTGGAAAPSDPPPPPPRQGPAPGGAAPGGDAPLASPDATAGARSTLTGLAAPGQEVAIERFVRSRGAWKRVATAAAGPDGTFTATWTPKKAGRQRMRVVPAGEAAASSAPPEVELLVYRAAVASWYGPGFYGRRTACGYRMSRSLVGVAHKKLPCGTQVALRYGDRTITVPVVDRGPYVRGREYDLTAATAYTIAFGGLDELGAVALRHLPRAEPPVRSVRKKKRRR